MLVATRRPLDPAAPSVRAVGGEIGEIVELARAAAGERDVYIDGGVMIRQALDAGLIDDLLGRGPSLFDGVARRRLELLGSETFEDGLVQLHLTCASS